MHRTGNQAALSHPAAPQSRGPRLLPAARTGQLCRRRKSPCLPSHVQARDRCACVSPPVRPPARQGLTAQSRALSQAGWARSACRAIRHMSEAPSRQEAMMQACPPASARPFAAAAACVLLKGTAQVEGTTSSEGGGEPGRRAASQHRGERAAVAEQAVLRRQACRCCLSLGPSRARRPRRPGSRTWRQEQQVQRTCENATQRCDTARRGSGAECAGRGTLTLRERGWGDKKRGRAPRAGAWRAAGRAQAAAALEKEPRRRCYRAAAAGSAAARARQQQRRRAAAPQRERLRRACLASSREKWLAARHVDARRRCCRRCPPLPALRTPGAVPWPRRPRRPFSAPHPLPPEST
jgi:hypothetical protein